MSTLNKNKAGRIVLARIILFVLTEILVSALFGFVRNSGNNLELGFYLHVLPVLRIVFGILFALALVYFVLTLVKKKDTSACIVTPAMILIATAHLFITAMLYNQFRITPFLFYTLTAIACVLLAVYYIYTILLYKK